MEWIPAIIGLLSSLVLAFFTAQWTARREREKIREQLKLEYSIETAIEQLLTEQGWPLRTFDIVKHHIRGFSDDKLREYLVRSGAVAFEDQNGIELWGLLALNTDRLSKKKD